MEYSFIRQAVLEALKRGLVTRAELQKAEFPQSLSNSLMKALKRSARIIVKAGVKVGQCNGVIVSQ